MRALYRSGGAKALGGQGTLELLLYYAIPRRDVNPLAGKLMESFGSFANVLAAPVEDLIKAGVSENAAVLIRMFGEIAEKGPDAPNKPEREPPPPILNSKDASERMKTFFSNGQSERVCLLCLDEKGAELFCGIVFIGNINSVKFSIRDVTVPAVLCGASKIYLAHNHTKGTSMPSADDLDTTLRILDSLSSNSIELCEHFVFRGAEYGAVIATVFGEGGRTRP
ncbi:MAG: RadC family protein [Clostridia bacterium]|nr:RadC family protein [Clostridia bacterium]